MKNVYDMLHCLAYIKQAIDERDEDMLRSYTEQFNDLVSKSIKEA